MARKTLLNKTKTDPGTDILVETDKEKAQLNSYTESQVVLRALETEIKQGLGHRASDDVPVYMSGKSSLSRYTVKRDVKND